MGVKNGLEIGHDSAPKQDRVRDLHHRGLEVQRKERAIRLGHFNLLGKESVERLGRHECRIHDGARREGHAVLENGDGAVAGLMFDPRSPRLGISQGHGCFIGAEVARRHGGHARFRLRRPCAHRMGIGLRVGFDSRRRATVGVALTQDRVHRGPLDRIITRAHVSFGICARLFGIVGQGVALALQFLDRSHELRDGGRDIGQLDHIGSGVFHQFAQFREIIGLALILGQVLGEGGNNAARKRDILGTDADTCSIGKGPNDRQQRRGRELGRLINFGVNDVGRRAVCHVKNLSV
mmetsp:Transcript_23331/g.40563  ORF Transcript_23331/g.40563 Transcript_23331/m.40563 type:complete len:294 (+) Transcript_23331:5114-5995(+)